MNVAVTCGASPIMADVVGLLREIPFIDSIVLLDSEPIVFDHGCSTWRVPYGASSHYADIVKSICVSESIEFIYIGSDDEALSLAGTSWAPRITHVDDFERVALVLNKLALHSALGTEFVPPFVDGTSRSEVYKLADRVGSIIERPVVGRGSRGLRHLHAAPDAAVPDAILVQEAKVSPDSFYTEFLPGDKFSADCIFARGELLTCMIRNNGSAIKYRPPTMEARACVDSSVFNFSRRVGAALNLSGFHQIECGKTAEGDVRLIEINPRLDATLPITRCYTKNFYELLITGEAVGLMTPIRPLFKRFYCAQVK